MAVKIRLQRYGKKNFAFFHIVVADSRAPRDGRYIEQLGTYNPNTNPATIVLDSEKALSWLKVGAQPSLVVRRIFSYEGVLLRKHLNKGVEKGALTQEQADQKWNAWKAQRDAKIEAKKEGLVKEAADLAKAAREAERKVNNERAEALAKKAEELAEAERKAAAETAAAKAAAAAEAVTAEAPATEEAKPEAPAEEALAAEEAKPEAPAKETPAAEEAKPEAPAAKEAPAKEAPAAEAPAKEAPAAEAPAAEAPAKETPATKKAKPEAPAEA